MKITGATERKILREQMVADESYSIPGTQQATLRERLTREIGNPDTPADNLAPAGPLLSPEQDYLI